MEWLEFMVGGDVPQQPLLLHQCAVRAVVIYLAGVIIVRMGKSRIISRVTTIDVLLGFILGSLLSRGITGHASLSGTLISSAALVATHFAMTRLATKGGWIEQFLKGHVRLLVEDGRVFAENLSKSHLSEDDLLEELRLNGVESVNDVKSARKERNGEISVVKRRSE